MSKKTSLCGFFVALCDLRVSKNERGSQYRNPAIAIDGYSMLDGGA